MKRAALLVTALLGVPASGALAADWTVKSLFSQELQVSDNAFLRTAPVGETYSSISTLMLDAVGRTPTMRFQLNADVSYLTYAGPGAMGTPNALGYGAKARLEKTDRLTTYHLATSYRHQDATSAQLAELGVVTIGGAIITQTIEGGFEHQLSSIDTIKWSTIGKSVEFTSPSGTPYTDVMNTATWTRRISPITQLTAFLQFERQAMDDATHTEFMIWRAKSGLRTDLTRRLTLNANIGAAFIKTTLDAPPGPTVAESGSSAGLIGDLELIYKLKTGQISIFASRTIAPTILGDILKSDIVGLAFRYDVNRLANWFGSTSFAQSAAPSGGNASETFSANVGYGYRLTRELQMQLSYRFLQRESNAGTAKSNTILFRLTHDYTILP